MNAEFATKHIFLKIEFMGGREGGKPLLHCDLEKTIAFTSIWRTDVKATLQCHAPVNIHYPGLIWPVRESSTQ